MGKYRRQTVSRPGGWGVPMIMWAGWLMVFYGAAHTIGALTIEEAARHAGAWFSGELWQEDFADMSAAGSAYWLSLASFGVPMILLGLMVVWLNRRGIAPPEWIAWVLGVSTIVDAVVLLFTPWPLLMTAVVLLLIGIRRARREDPAVPGVRANS